MIGEIPYLKLNEALQCSFLSMCVFLVIRESFRPILSCVSKQNLV